MLWGECEACGWQMPTEVASIYVRIHERCVAEMRANPIDGVPFPLKPFEEFGADHVDAHRSACEPYLRLCLSNGAPQPGSMNGSGELKPALTPRLREVLQRLLRGMKNPEIAKDMNIAPNTLKGHRSTLIALFEVTSMEQVLVKAIQAGWHHELIEDPDR